MIIAIDMDETICNFLEYLCIQYNYKYNKDLKPERIDKWSLLSFIGLEGIEIYKQSGFFKNLIPFEYALSTIYRLNQKHTILICSDPPNPISASDKMEWIEEYMPFLKHNQIVLTAAKEHIRADLLFDDSPIYMERFPGIKVCMARPYNVGCGDYRVESWREFEELINRIDNNIKIYWR